jgi:subtilisin family serine protease
VDTGVDLTHPDLVNKIVPGYDMHNNDADPSDDEGHGTHVASIAAASSNNGQGIAGMSWGARIMPIKVLGADGSGRSSNVASGIIWATDNGARVINLSLGGANYSTAVQNAVNYAHNRGVLVVAAAGNHYKKGNPTTYPAAYANVLAVAATNDRDGHASYSSSGSYVDVAAPGGDPSGSSDSNSRSWIPGAYWRGSGVSYAWLSGTSQAAPHAAGLAALLLSLNPNLTPGQLQQIITSTAVDVQAPGWDEFSGHGRIDVKAALNAAASIAAAPPPTATPVPMPIQYRYRLHLPQIHR